MNKRFILVVMTFVALALVSCNREDPTPNNPNNPGEFDTYQEIEAYCLENGWTERSLNAGEDFLDCTNCMSLFYQNNGTLLEEYVNYQCDFSYKLLSSFNSLISTTNAPSDGYIDAFTCENEKFGICKWDNGGYNSSVWPNGYAKFYIRRVNQNKIKILYKKCDW